ncbi:MlaD family protein [Bosea sp. UC22_33]|uniref:MlaD family protein n=1 Tax=Bosea sp. UC22_33 TaxID=3350165 RepID=UPI00366CC3C0
MVVVAALFGLAYWFSRGRTDTVDVRLIFNGKISGLGRGSSVLFNGLRVGEVTDIEIEPSDPRQIYAILKISQSAPLRTDTTARLEGQGLAGIVAVQLRGGNPHAARLTPAPGQMQPTIVVEDSASIFEKVGSIAKSIDESLVAIDGAIQANGAPITERIKEVERFSASLNDSSSSVERLMKGVEAVAEFVTPLPGKLKTFGDDYLDSLRTVDKNRIVSIIGDFDQLTSTLAGVAPDVRSAIKTAASVGEKLNRASDNVDGVLKGARSFLDAAVDTNGRSAFTEIAETAKSLNALAASLDRSSAAATVEIIRMTGAGLKSVESFTSTGRGSLSGFVRTLENVNRNPQSLLFGSKNRVPEYRGSR